MAVRAAIGRLVGLPVLNDRPIHEGKELPIVGDQGIGLQQSSHGRLVKANRRGYHSQNLLLVDVVDLLILCKRRFVFGQCPRTKVL